MDLMVVTKLQWHNTEIYLYYDHWEADALDHAITNPIYWGLEVLYGNMGIMGSAGYKS